MASKRQKKKNLKKLGLWEGRQYRGGREKDVKNLRRVDGGYKNQHGVTFTEEQKKALERAVNRSNYRRKKMSVEFYGPPTTKRPDPNQLYLMGADHSDFIISRQSKSLQRFKSIEEYEQFMDKQARIQSGEYFRDKARLYKRNFITSLMETYGDEAKDIAMKIRMMKPEEYMKKVASDEVLEIRFVPSDMLVSGRLNQLRAALGMKLKDEWLSEEFDVDY